MNARHCPSAEDMAERAAAEPFLALAERQFINPGDFQEVRNVERGDCPFQTPIENVLRTGRVDRTVRADEDRLGPRVRAEHREPLRQVPGQLHLHRVVIRYPEVREDLADVSVLRIRAQRLRDRSVEAGVRHRHEAGIRRQLLN